MNTLIGSLILGTIVLLGIIGLLVMKQIEKDRKLPH